MGTALTGSSVASTYDALLKITDNGPVGASVKVVTDGLGNDSALKLGTGGIEVAGTISVSGHPTLEGVTATGATGTGKMVFDTSPTLVTPNLGTPSALVVTNASGTASININGTVGATTPSTGAFTTLSATGNTLLNTTGGLSLLTLGDGAAGTYSRIVMRSSNSVRGWAVGVNDITADAWTLAPSTANGGNTYTTPVLTVSTTGLAVTGSGTFTSSSAVKLTLAGGSNQNALEFNSANGASKFYVGAGTDLISGGDSGFAILDASAGYAGRFFISSAGAISLLGDTSVTGTLGASGTATFASGTAGETVRVRAGDGVAKIEFGSSSDVNLYRSAADRLTTDDDFTIGTTNTDPTNNRVTGMYITNLGRIYARAAGSWDLGSNSSTPIHISFYTDNGSARVSAGSISSSGSTTSFNTASDARLKTNIRGITDSGAILDAVQPRIFDWKTGEKDTYGFVAQELYSVFPQAVSKGDDDPDTITQQWAVDPSKLVPVLVAELKSLRARVAEIETA